jgi:hypothetical protein
MDTKPRGQGAGNVSINELMLDNLYRKATPISMTFKSIRRWKHHPLENSTSRHGYLGQIVCIVILVLYILANFVFFPFIPNAKVYGHVGEVSERNITGDTGGMENHGENKLVILSRFISGDIDLSANPSLPQWKESFENNVRSIWGHDISVKTINNGTHIFFLLTWNDSTMVPVGAKDKVQKVSDGSAIIFERPKERQLNQTGVEGEPAELKDSWYWSANSPTTAGIITKAEQGNGNWNVVIGREIQSKNKNESSITFQTGVREEAFVKFVVWDGSKGESLAQVNDELLPHYDFVLLPEINVYPKDIYVWSGVLAASAVLFLFVEQRLYKNSDKSERVVNS